MDKENENIKGIEEEVSKKVEEIQINSADDNVNYDDDEDNLDYETMRKEANEHGLDIEIYEGEDPYGIIDEEDDELYDEKVKESLEEESFKNDEDFKKMLDRKKLIGISAFPQFEAEGEIYSVDIDEKKEVAILGDGEEMFYTVSLADFTCISKEKLHKDSIISAKYSADKSYFITASMDGVVKIFDATTMKCIHTIEDNSEEIMVRVINLINLLVD